MSERIGRKEQLTVFDETGLSLDYFNEIRVVCPSDATVPKICAFLRSNPRRKYAERYPQSKYLSEIVTDYNREDIATLDKLVDEMNGMTDPTSFDMYRFIEVYNHMVYIVFGSIAGNYCISCKDIN